MPFLLVIRLYPVEQIPGDDFTNYLNGLSIAAHEVSFADPDDSIGPALGPAGYIAPTLPASPSPAPNFAGARLSTKAKHNTRMLVRSSNPPK